ncbi:hypothetical protein [Gimesia aquarii]|uniref:Uncharacterized protein n=1 Tax=Gimesia aquarii TaxID=2527964 RepID=A0A517WPX3_9PLAN|nr:hypothetical protein [Gimesia aquarii]QDT95359.1 hypothetical protein V144x_08010 [Gimesia aquarii]QDU07317.1 hypothetical protein V202x_06690 [Gimesia aquarii]
MKRALTVAMLASSVLFVGAIESSEARPPVWKQIRRQSRQLERNFRQASRDVQRFDRQLNNNINRYQRRYNNYYYRGSGARFYSPGFGYYYGW